MDEPPVKLEIRTGGSDKPYAFRFENEWPLARTKWTKMYLQLDQQEQQEGDQVEGTLSESLPNKTAQISYPSSAITKAGIASGSSLSTTHGNVGRTGISLKTKPMTSDMEITGPLMCNLWVSSTSEDMDIMITLRNIDANGND